jgi:hypothetical protein
LGRPLDPEKSAFCKEIGAPLQNRGEAWGALSDLLMMLWFGVRVFLYGANPGSAPDPVETLMMNLL